MNTKIKIAVARALSSTLLFFRRLVGKTPRALVTRQGIRWDLDMREGIDLAIYLFGAFEPETVRAYSRVVKPGDCVLDIGANIGAHTLHLARCVGAGGRVMAFEPTAYAVDKLRRNLALNPSLEAVVEVNQRLLTDDAAEPLPESIASSWPLTADREGLHAVHLGRPQTLDGASAIRLDDALKQVGSPRIAFIKLDVDGFEMNVLRGASAFFAEQKPVILMELCDYVLVERGSSLAELLDFLKGFGYRAWHPGGAQEIPLDRLALEKIIPRGGSINALLKSA